jgi:hypothetical protein
MSKLDDAVQESVAVAAAAFDASTDKAAIKAATTVMIGVLTEWHAKHDAVKRAVGGLLETVRRGCDHEGASRGYNDRDGSWMAPCPHCGDSR